MSSALIEPTMEIMPDGSEKGDPFPPLAAMLAHVEDSAVVFSAEGELAIWNPGAEKLFGYSFEEACRKEISFLAPPEESGDTIKLFARALSGLPVQPRLVDRIHKDGTRVRISLRASPLKGADGSIFGVLFMGRDVVSEVERENRLTELQLREREIATLVPDALYVHRDGKIVWVNQAAVDMFGAQSATDLLGRMAWDFIVETDLGKVLVLHAALGPAGASTPILVDRKRLDGTVFPTEGRGAAIAWEDEPATLMVVRDLTEQERAVSALAESEARQRDFAEVSPDAMLVHLDGEIVFANEAALAVFGAGSRDDFIGLNVVDTVHPEDRELVVGNWEAWRKGKGEDVVVVRRMRLDGTSFHGEGRHRSIIWKGKKAYLVVIRDVSERISAQQALQESEARHRQIVDVSPDGILIHVDEQIVFANLAAQDMFGASSAEDLVGLSSLDIVPDDLKEFVLARRKQVAVDGTAPTVEVRRKRLDGTEFVAEVTGSKYTWDGRPATLTIARDVTDRVLADQARAALENRYLKILELTPEATFVHVGGKIAYVNPAAVAMFGAESPEDLIGYGIGELIHPDERARIANRQTSMHEGVYMPVDYVRRLRLDGTPFESSYSATVIEWNGEQGYLVIAADVTEQLAKDEALSQSESRHRTMTEASPDAIIVHLDRKIVFANQVAAEMFGVDSPDGLVGRRAIDFVHKDDREDLMATNKILETGQILPPHVARRLRDNGEVFHSESTRSGYSWNGETAMMAVIRDISERYESEQQIRDYTEELERTNEELERFAYVASHDLKEPLRMVSSFCGLLQERYADQLDEQANEFIRFAVDGAKRMHGLIEDLLRMSRAGTADLVAETVDIAGTLEDVERNLSAQIVETGAEVTYGEMPTVVGDKTLLNQLFQNLVSNAIKFRSEAPPLIKIESTVQGSEQVFVVSDNGIGLDPKHHERVFEVFKTLHARDKFEGNGIGLSICKKVVERHGGSIWIDSTPGRGTSFWFTLPVLPKALES